MNSQPLAQYAATALAAEQPTPPPFPQQRPHTGPLWRLWKGWLWLTGPRPGRFGTDIAGQERLRRSRLVSVLLVVVAAAILLLIVGAVTLPILWQAVLLDSALGLCAVLLNRVGQVTLSGLTIIALIDFGVLGFIITEASNSPTDPGLSYHGVGVFYIFILGTLTAGMVLPNRFILLIGALHVGLIVAVFSLLPPSHLLQAEILAHDGGQGYETLLGPILVQVCGAADVWLFAWSVDHAILRASRAEELAEARARLNVQTRQIAGQKRRLEEAISVVQNVQARVANGDYSARVSLQENELLPLAVSFNILAERLGRHRSIEQDYHRLEGALQQLLEACSALARGAAPAAMRATGTVADRIYPFLTRMQHIVSRSVQVGAMAEDLHIVLQRQHGHLDELENRLVASLSLAKDLAIETAQGLPLSPAERTSRVLGMPGTGGSGPLGGQEKSEARSAAILRIKNLFDQQIALLEQSKTLCAQASGLSTNCTVGVRILSQRLKEAG